MAKLRGFTVDSELFMVNVFIIKIILLLNSCRYLGGAFLRKGMNKDPKTVREAFSVPLRTFEKVAGGLVWNKSGIIDVTPNAYYRAS